MTRVHSTKGSAAPSVVDNCDQSDEEHSQLLNLNAAATLAPAGNMRKVKSFSDTHKIRDLSAASGAASARCLRPYEQVTPYPEGSEYGGNSHYGAPSVRSLASIGMGCTDGRKMVIRRVPTSPTELFHLVRPPT